VSRPAFRTDLQALRGFAVLIVLLYHARIQHLRAGYLGVDVFFVLSGYLITRVIKDAVEQETFSFSGFYLRRAKRLLPAAYVTFFVTALIAPFVLTALEFKAFLGQLLGAVTLSANIVLWLQSGYFTIAAELKPLLHVWSLSLEEQYYLILPATLVFVPRRYWLRVGVGILAGSLALCAVLNTRAPEAAFYLLPARAWELAIGSVATLAALEGTRVAGLMHRLFWPAVAVLLVIPVWPVGTPEPGLNAVLVCCATVVLIVGRHRALNQGLVPRALARVGDFSYSLYLVHWPLFAFLANAYQGEIPRQAYVLAAVLALILGYALYALVELPFRRAELRWTRKVALAAVAASALLVVLPWLAYRSRGVATDFAYLRRINFGLGGECEFTDRFTVKPACRSSESPAILVWGDSYAMHLVPGITAETDLGVLQATRSTCGPFEDIATVSTVNPSYRRSWAEACLGFNRSVLGVLARSPAIKLVVLSGEVGKYLMPSRTSGWRLVSMIDGRWVEEEPSVSLALSAMRRTVDTIRALGKRVVVVAPPPSLGFDIGICLERKATGKLILGVDPACRLPVSEYHRRRAPQLEFLTRLPREAGVGVVSFDPDLCDARFCSTELDGIFLYRDGGHLSYDGSRAIARRMKLWDQLQAAAR
jgi:peptidoglycan/LPS O-acetylase OafA/YrhL